MSIKPLIAFAVLAALWDDAVAEDDYKEIAKLVDGRGAGETRDAARARWKKAKDKLDKMSPGSPKDYRYCYFRAIALFRLDGPEASRDERKGCTLPFVNGTRHDGKNAEPGSRAEGINELSALVEEFLQAEVNRLTATLQAVKDRGKATVIVTQKAIEDLVKSGRISPAEGKKLLDQLNSVDASFDLKIEKLDPTKLKPDDLDWDKLDLDKVPADFKEKLLKHKVQGAPGTGGSTGGVRK